MFESFRQRFHQRSKYAESIDQIMRLSDKELAKKTERVKRSFINIPIIPGRENEKGEKYPYSQFEPTADLPFQASLFEDAADLIIHNDPEIFKNVDIILSEGDRGGGPLAQAIGIKAGQRVSLANWHKNIPEGLPDTKIVETRIGFSGEGSIVVSGIKRGQRIVLVDELLSTGGTAEALIKAVEEAGGIIVGAFFIGEKVDQNGRDRLTKQFPNLNIKTLVRFNARIENGFTTDAESDRIFELIGSKEAINQEILRSMGSMEALETIHEIANYENDIYDDVLKNILRNFKRRLLIKFSRKELESMRGEAKKEMMKTIKSIEEEYSKRQNIKEEEQIQERVAKILGR